MKTTARCKTTWTHKLEHKFAAKQLDSRINHMQKKNIWNRQTHTIWRSRLPEVLSTMLGLARTSKITGLSNQGIIKCVPSGYTCHDLFSSTLNEHMWNNFLKGKKKVLLLFLLLPFSRFPQNKKKRHHNCKRVDDWKKEATVPYPWRRRYDWRLWHDVLPPHCTSCSQLHTIRCLLWPPAWPAPPSGLQTEASRCACCWNSSFQLFFRPRNKNFCLRMSSQMSYWLHNDRANGRTSTLRNGTDKSRVVKVLAMPN